MKLGDKIKNMRNDLGLSQPEMAEQAGIEQSYLSKLENNKCIPSNDVFLRLLSALGTKTDDFIRSFESEYIESELLKIPDVKAWVQSKQANSDNLQKRILTISCILLIAGFVLFYAGKSAVIFDEAYYRYESSGILYEGESKHLLTSWRSTLPSGSQNREQREKLIKSFEERMKTEVVLKKERLGSEFEIDVDDGYRVFKLKGKVEKARLVNGWIELLGVFCFVSGIVGLYVERRRAN